METKSHGGGRSEMSENTGVPRTLQAGFQYPTNAVFLWFQTFSLKVECSVLATKLFDKPPLAILNGTSNPIGLHNEHSLFQRISIHLHYDMKASKHLTSLLTTD
jgi:hypothetical protein